MIKKSIIIILCVITTGCNSQPGEFRLFEKGKLIPEVVFADKKLQGAAENFCRFFEEATGQHLVPASKASGTVDAIIKIAFLKENQSDGHFRIKQQGNEIYIEGSDKNDIDSGIRFFFSHFVHIDPITEGVSGVKFVDEINIPSGLNYKEQYAFEYREPYFPDNFNPEFRLWNNTHTLEEHWGLWGHNIGKAIAITQPMHATVGGKNSDEQLCFSSSELEIALTNFIKAKSKENPAQSKFMVMPYDNELVCTCAKCKATGNDENNASPAVFSLINKLAAKFPEREFFSTSYITTQTPPKFQLAANAGVMVSTMQFPKGVVIASTPQRAEVERTFNAWKAVASKIYLWDYAVNFDNFFDAYPTVKIAQQNLKLYKNLGVTGVFMHGSEENYSAFGSLKCYLYAQLFQDPGADIDRLTQDFYARRYPAAAALLSSYYLTQENRALESMKQLDIYGGIKQSEKKYLDATSFSDFYDKLIESVNSLTIKEATAIKPLLLSLTFQRLELMRTKGLGAGGYGTIEGTTLKINPLADVLLDRLAKLSDDTGIKIINESGSTISDYIRAWRRDITPAIYKNLAYGKKLRFIGTPDEEYADARILTDGAVGFTDYYNNWLLSTAGELSVEINAGEVRGARYIEMSFLNDPRHNIYLPEKVVVTISGRKYEATIEHSQTKKASKKSIKIPIISSPEDNVILIQTVKQKDFKSKSVACDEVYFK